MVAVPSVARVSALKSLKQFLAFLGNVPSELQLAITSRIPMTSVIDDQQAIFIIIFEDKVCEALLQHFLGGFLLFSNWVETLPDNVEVVLL